MSDLISGSSVADATSSDHKAAVKENVDVAIIGYGPGGAVLASLLGQRGYSVVVLEKFSGPYNLPRMSTLDGEIARVLQHASNATEALKGSIPQATGNLFGADGLIAKTIDWDSTTCGHPSRLSLHQPNIEAAIHARVNSCLSVRVHWGMAATSIQDFGDHVIVTGSKAKSDVEAKDNIQIRASYVVGMDGASSFIRQAVGVKMDILKKHEDEWLMTDFDIIDPVVKTPSTDIHMDVPRPYYWGPNGERRCRIDMKLLPDDGDDVRTHAYALGMLKEKFGILPKSVRITRQVTYRFRTELADTMRRGNIFLGGDAAHLMTPGMAQGSCSAMRDSINLAWRLDLVLGAGMDPAILDSYGPERLGHVAPLVVGSLMMWAMASQCDEAKAAFRDMFLRSGKALIPPTPPLTTGLLQHLADGSLAPLAGTLSPQGKLRIGERDGLLDDLVGFGFQLVSRVPVEDILSPTHRALLTKLNTHVVILDDDNTKDIDGTYRAFLDEHRIVAYLSRPDFYIFGAAATPADIRLLGDATVAAFEHVDPPKSIVLPGAAFSHHTLPIDGLELHYAEAAPPVPIGTIVSLPGSAGLEMSTAKDLLAKRYRVIEVNPPGWSDQEVTRSFTQSEVGKLLARAVGELLKGPFLLLATSIGGANALYLTEQMPDKVLGIVLEGSMTPSRPQDMRPMGIDVSPPHPKKPWATPSYVAHQMANRLRTVSHTPPDFQAPSAIRAVRELGIPVLALVGTDDEILSPSQEEAFKGALPAADFRLVPGGRHDLQNTTPDEFVSYIQAFWEKISSI